MSVPPAANGRTDIRRVVAAAIIGLMLFAGAVVVRSLAVRRAESLTEAAPIPSEASPAIGEIESLAPVVARGGVLQLDIFKSFKYVDERWVRTSAYIRNTVAGGLDTRPYEKLHAEPRYRSPEPFYGYLPLGNGPDTRITFVIDELKKPTSMLYVDKNNNEDLTDDGPPYDESAGSKWVAATITLPVELVTSSGNTVYTPYKLWFWVGSNQPPDGPYRARFFSTCHYIGKVDLGGRLFTAVAFEFERHTALFAENGVWIDLNGDGALEKETEHFLNGELVRVEDDVYRIELTYP